MGSTLRRSAVFVLAVLLAAGCGGEAVDSTTATSAEVAAVARGESGTELSGLAFDVRRDPG